VLVPDPYRELSHASPNGMPWDLSRDGEWRHPLATMKTVSILLGLVLVAVFVVRLVARNRGAGSTDEDWPFYAKKPLTPPEQVLFHRLVKALPEHIVLAQVQLSRALGVKKGFNFHEWNNRINRMSYDFLICAKDSTVLAAIELDDRSHESATRVAADVKKERASAAAGISLIRWNVKALPDDTAIRSAVLTQRAVDTALHKFRVEPTFDDPCATEDPGRIVQS
jgi:hypothetical protein